MTIFGAHAAVARFLQVQLEPIRRVSGSAAGQLAPKYTGMLQAVRTIVREEGVLVSIWLDSQPGI